MHSATKQTPNPNPKRQKKKKPAVITMDSLRSQPVEYFKIPGWAEAATLGQQFRKKTRKIQ